MLKLITPLFLFTALGCIGYSPFHLIQLDRPAWNKEVYVYALTYDDAPEQGLTIELWEGNQLQLNVLDKNDTCYDGIWRESNGTLTLTFRRDADTDTGFETICPSYSTTIDVGEANLFPLKRTIRVTARSDRFGGVAKAATLEPTD